MPIETIPLTRLEANLRATLSECADSGRPVVVELPDHRLVAIQPLEPTEDDDLTDKLLEATVKPDQPLMRVANVKGPWEAVVQIPEANVGRIKEALAKNEGRPLSVDILLVSHSKTYKGLLYGGDLGGETTIDAEHKPVLFARVQIVDITRAELDHMPVGAEVRVKVRCGKRSIGYVWFYELGEFIYEHLLF